MEKLCNATQRRFVRGLELFSDGRNKETRGRRRKEGQREGGFVEAGTNKASQIKQRLDLHTNGFTQMDIADKKRRRRGLRQGKPDPQSRCHGRLNSRARLNHARPLHTEITQTEKGKGRLTSP